MNRRYVITDKINQLKGRLPFTVRSERRTAPEIDIQGNTQVALVGVEGNLFTNVVPASSIDTLARCPYCLEPLQDVGAENVVCSVCRTPHHRECWNVNGGCTTFGCRLNPLNRR